MIDKDKLKRRFSRNAKQYDKYANVQKIMGDKLISIIDNKNIKNILEIGCGTGYVTRSLKEHFPEAKITAVDIAPGMIEYVKSTIPNADIEFVCGDVEEMVLSEEYDLIISNATFQWFNHFDKTVGKLIGQLGEDGSLIFSTFGEKTFIELHGAFKKAKKILDIDEAVSPGQRFYSLKEIETVCKKIKEEKGLENIKISPSEDLEYEYFDCCRDFLISVKKIGANNSQSNRNKVAPDFIEKVMEIYDRDYSYDDKVRATYHNLFISMKNTK